MGALNGRRESEKSLGLLLAGPPLTRAPQHPESPSPSAPLLLGLLHINASKDPLLPGGEAARAAAYERGLLLIQQAFKRDNTSSSAAAMGPLSRQLLLQPGPGTSARALKLAGRMLAFTDARLLVAEAHLARARALDADPDTASHSLAEILASYQRAIEANPDLTVAHLGAAGCHIRLEQYPTAIFALETLLRRQPKCVEALAALGAIQTTLAFTFHAVSDSAGARKSAKESYEAVLRIFKQGKQDAAAGGGDAGAGGGADRLIAKSERIRSLAEDRDLYLEIARLWGDDQNVERSLNAYVRAAEIEADAGATAADATKREEEEDIYADGNGAADEEKPTEKDHVDPRIRNNLGVLFFNRRPHAAAAAAAAAAAISASGADGGASSSQPTAIQQDLYRAQEEFERALQKLGAGLDADRASCGLDAAETDADMTAISFNLAACYEALGDVEKAKTSYEILLGQHREFVDGESGPTVGFQDTLGGALTRFVPPSARSQGPPCPPRHPVSPPRPVGPVARPDQAGADVATAERRAPRPVHVLPRRDGPAQARARVCALDVEGDLAARRVRPVRVRRPELCRRAREQEPGQGGAARPVGEVHPLGRVL